MTTRHDGRSPDQLRPISIQRPFRGAAPGSLLISAGETTILCTASIDDEVPPWKKHDETPSGWVTAEYNMLPGSTAPRKRRDRGGKVDGRSTEIQRLIGRSLRSVVDMQALGPRTITVDCDVDCGRRRDSHAVDHRRVYRAGRCGLVDPRTQRSGPQGLHRQRRGGQCGDVRPADSAGPQLCRRQSGRGRYERRDDRQRTVHRGAGNGRRRAVFPYRTGLRNWRWRSRASPG